MSLWFWQALQRLLRQTQVSPKRRRRATTMRGAAVMIPNTENFQSRELKSARTFFGLLDLCRTAAYALLKRNQHLLIEESRLHKISDYI
jgi:hypothetical protein